MLTGIFWVAVVDYDAGGRCDRLLPLSSQFWVGQLVEFWLAGVPDGWVSIPILTRLATVGSRAYLRVLYILQAPRLLESVLERA